MTIRTLLLPLALASLLAGCASDSDAGEWSSKQSSSVSGGTRSPGLTLSEQPVGAQERAAPPQHAPPPRAVAASMPAGLRADARPRALNQLDQSSRDNWALLRANAIEALSADPGAVEPVAARGLVDANRGVRFVAVSALARVSRCDLAHLVEPLLSDGSDSVRAAAIAMLAACGRPVDQSPLAAMVMSDDPEIRANAYLALGHIGNKSAVQMVRASLGRGMLLADSMRVRVVELQAAECLVRLGETSEIEPIRAALFAPGDQGELTVLACQIIGRLRDQHARPMLFRLVEASAEAARASEIRIAAIDAIGRIGGDPTIWSELRPFLTSPQPALRAQAASAAGSLAAPELLGEVVHLLDDPDPTVRTAASGAVLRLTAAPAPQAAQAGTGNDR